MTWIEFTDEHPSASGKTNSWLVRASSDGTVLGRIAWHAPWRCYGFCPAQLTVFEKDCLRLIADFCETRTREHKHRLQKA